MEIRRIGIIGLGAVGTMYGDAFTKAFGRDSVFFIADAARIARYKTEGIVLNGTPCNFRYAASDECGEKADLILFTVKYTGLPQAIESVRPFVGEHTILLSALNGVVSERDIAAVYGEQHLLYCSVQGMDATKHGKNVRFQKYGSFALGGPEEEVAAVCAALDRAGLAWTRPKDIQHQLWSKMMLNTGCNQVTAARGLTYRGIQEPGEARDEMRAAMVEAQHVAAHEGVQLDDSEIENWIALIDTLDPDSMTSMRQDTQNHRKTELALFAGTVCRLGRKHGVPTPVNDRLFRQIRALERSFCQA